MDKDFARKSRPCFLIADDHTIFAEALRAYLEKRYPVVGVVPDGLRLCEPTWKKGIPWWGWFLTDAP
jgi:hypothetical protein